MAPYPCWDFIECVHNVAGASWLHRGQGHAAVAGTGCRRRRFPDVTGEAATSAGIV